MDVPESEIDIAPPLRVFAEGRVFLMRARGGDFTGFLGGASVKL